MNPAFIGNIIEKVSGAGEALINKVTSGKDKSQANKEMTETIMEAVNSVIAHQADIIKTETTGNKLQRSWRPILMLTFGFIIVFVYFVCPVIDIWYNNPEFTAYYKNFKDEKGFWELLKLGLGGYVIGRSVEKVSEKASNTIGLNLLKKKDRKDKI